MMRKAQRQSLVIFLHMPKTAGSTLARIIGRQYAADSIICLYDSMLGEELAAIPPVQLDHLHLIMGHLYFGVHTYLSSPSTYITVLREPVDRVISYYYYVRRDPSHYLHDSAHKLSLKEFVESCNRQEPNNDQTRLLAGKGDASSFGICTDGMLEIAKRNLAEHFTVVGLTEDFDRSLILMKRKLGWRNPFYISQNVSEQRLRKDEIPLETLHVIEAYNQLDIELYHFAQDLFQGQVSSQDSSFENELHRFKKLNRFYGRLWLLLSSARRGAGLNVSLARHQFVRYE